MTPLAKCLRRLHPYMASVRDYAEIDAALRDFESDIHAEIRRACEPTGDDEMTCEGVGPWH